MHPPEIIVRQLDVGRSLEIGDHAALDIERPEDGAGEAILAGGVTALEHDEQGTLRFSIEGDLQLHQTRQERLLERLNDPLKNWKFQVGDLEERKRWEEYTEAYEDVLEQCSTDVASWYVVPGDRKSTRNLLIAQVVVAALERVNPRFPRVDPKVLEVARQWERETAAKKRIDD